MDEDQLDTLVNTVETLRRLVDGLLRAQGRIETLDLLELDEAKMKHLTWQHHHLSLISMLGLGLSALADGDPDRAALIADQIERLPSWDR